MSKIASRPLVIPSGVELSLASDKIEVKGPKGSSALVLDGSVLLSQQEQNLSFVAADTDKKNKAMLGMVRALVQNMVIGVISGFERRLQLSGVGYRAELRGSNLHMSLGLSHPVVFELPAAVTAELPSATEITLRSIDKQLLGQVAANIRALRPPEPYKGKGIRYHDERLRLKETKKKT